MAQAAPTHPRRPPGQDELPHDDGVPLESKRVREQGNVLIQSLDDLWSARDDVFVGGNMFLYFSELQTRRNDFRGPDVFVVLGTERRERKSWVVWEEGGRAPNVVIELLSDTTRAIDRGEKMAIYGGVLRIPEYFLFDPESNELEGYALDAAALLYRRIEVDAKGDLPSRQLALGLGLRPGRIAEMEGPFLRWLDAAGNPVMTPSERADAERQRADAERQRADAERQRAERAESRLAELQAQLAARGGSDTP